MHRLVMYTDQLQVRDIFSKALSVGDLEERNIYVTVVVVNETFSHCFPEKSALLQQKQ